MKRFLLIFTGLFIIGCGYQMVGLGDAGNSKYTYHIADIINNANESDYRSMLDLQSNLFFTRYNSLESKENADYVLKFRLENVDTSSSINTTTNQSLRTDLRVNLHIQVLDKNGNNMFSKTFTRSTSFTITNNISTNRSNRNDAFNTTINEILLDFKNEYENQ